MRQRNGRQKFLNLRLLTFQDWVVPRYSSHIKTSEIMKNSRLPVFSYTKMDNGPPLSPISSQFAWAGHVLPDLVQEQSDRLLRRLERPKTADGRISRFRNSHINNGVNSRPMTAATTKKRTPLSTSFKVDGQKYENHNCELIQPVVTHDDQILQTQQEKDPTAHILPTRDTTDNLVSERSNSPDFIANLYKEYELKIATENMCDKSSTTNNHENEIPTPLPNVKLLRKPNPRPRLMSKTINRNSSSSQTSPSMAEKIVHVHCIVKLPNDQTDISYESRRIHSQQTPNRARSNKSDTWLDLSEIVRSSDDDDDGNFIANGLRVPRSSLASGSICSVKLTDIPSDCEDTQEIEKKPKMKPTRPNSSKSMKKTHNKSRMKKRRPHSSVEESKGRGKPVSRMRTCDKLREEIETQMSKLDFDNSARQKPTSTSVSHIKPQRLSMSADYKISPTKSDTSEKASSVLGSNGFISLKGSIPLKKIPIQILSDPFSSKFKVYHERDALSNSVAGL